MNLKIKVKSRISETCIGVSEKLRMVSNLELYSKGWEVRLGCSLPHYFEWVEEPFLSFKPIESTWSE
jgi:hypothetical protein